MWNKYFDISVETYDSTNYFNHKLEYILSIFRNIPKNFHTQQMWNLFFCKLYYSEGIDFIDKIPKKFYTQEIWNTTSLSFDPSENLLGSLKQHSISHDIISG